MKREDINEKRRYYIMKREILNNEKREDINESEDII
jgi:hypothetical protein